MKDYYRTLGILDDAEDIIIKAAYRALAQRYHPDKWAGDKAEATKRMTEINEAYSVLSDASNRKKYDDEFFKFKARDDATEQNSNGFFEEELDEIDEAWKLAVDFFPSIQNDFFELRKINSVLANTFKTALIESQEFKKSSELRKKYEKEYLIRFYGENKYIRNFVKFLLINNEKNAAVKVNAIVRHLGKSASFTQIYDKIYSEFPAISELNKAHWIEHDFERKIDTLLERIKFSQTTDEELVYTLAKHHKATVTLTMRFLGMRFEFTTPKNHYSLTRNEALILIKKIFAKKFDS
jgi:curved DNA-binding protein CbpA